MATSTLPQLRMRRAGLTGLPPAEAPQGYSIRAYRPGDEAAWADIMNTGIGSGWTADLCREKLTGQAQFDPSGLFFATSAGQPVGSACAWTIRPGDATGVLHMVCALPEHRGHRLGYWLSLAVLHRLAARGFSEVTLSTDDFRLAAIRAYLELGFEPAHTHPRDAERWLLVLARLGEAAPATPRPAMAPLPVMPIGVVRGGHAEIVHAGWEESVAEIVVEPALAEALDGFAAGDRVEVLFWLNRVTDEQRSIRKLHPRDRMELPLTGVFATRSQYRPNPIGLTAVDLLERRGNVLVVRGLDAVAGTPVLDLKPAREGKDRPAGG